LRSNIALVKSTGFVLFNGFNSRQYRHMGFFCVTPSEQRLLKRLKQRMPWDLFKNFEHGLDTDGFGENGVLFIGWAASAPLPLREPF